MTAKSVEGRITDSSQEIHHAVPYLHFLEKVNSDGTVLDIGIGDGTPLNRALIETQKNPKVIGAEFNPQDHLHSYRELGNMNVVAALGQQLPFPRSIFEGVISSQVIEHLSENEQLNLVLEMIDVVKIDGHCLIATLNSDFPHHTPGHDDHLHELNYNELTKLVEKLKQVRPNCEYQIFCVIPPEKFVNLKKSKARLAFLRAVKDAIPRKIKELVATFLSRGEKFSTTDFKIEKADEVADHAQAIDFLLEIHKLKS